MRKDGTTSYHTSYSERLRDPRWQRKRLEVMESDGWACVRCGDTGSTLNVDHKLYLRGRNPWEYEDNELQTLCESCHLKVTEERERLALAVAHFDMPEKQLLGYVHGCAMRKGSIDALSFNGKPSTDYSQGLADAYGGLGGPWLADRLNDCRRVTNADMMALRHAAHDETDAASAIKEICQMLVKNFPPSPKPTIEDFVDRAAKLGMSAGDAKESYAHRYPTDAKEV